MDYIDVNRKAWTHDAYNFWISQNGTPDEAAKKMMDNPLACLKKHAQYFETYGGLKVANVCGSIGKKAIPLVLLGSKVTVFDISEQNKRYACEAALKAGVQLDYVVGDVLEIDLTIFGHSFDVVFFEGGVLHYFHEIDAFMSVMNKLLKPEGKMICSDFHPFTKLSDTLDIEQPTMSYFSTDAFEGEMAHARFYPAEVRAVMPRCHYRKYTISEIINAIIHNGFNVKQFDEHPSWTDERLPGEFTVVAVKAGSV